MKSGFPSEGQNDIIEGGRMTSFCKCFWSVWFGGIRHFQFLFLRLPVSFPEYALLERGSRGSSFSLNSQHVANIFPCLTWELVPTLFVLLKLISKEPLRAVQLLNSRGFWFVPLELCTVARAMDQLPSPSCTCLKSARILQITSSGAFPRRYLEGPFSVLCGYNSTSCLLHP